MPDTSRTRQRALILHPPGSGADLLASELHRLGWVAETVWPIESRLEGEARLEVVFVADAQDQSALLAIAATDQPVVAVVNGEDAEAVNAATGAGAHGLLVLPLRRAAIGAQVQLALAAQAFRRRMETKVLVLERTLRSRRLIERATQVIAVMRGLSSDDAYDHLRRQAMRNRATMVETAQDFLVAIEGVGGSDVAE